MLTVKTDGKRVVIKSAEADEEKIVEELIKVCVALERLLQEMDGLKAEEKNALLLNMTAVNGMDLL